MVEHLTRMNTNQLVQQAYNTTVLGYKARWRPQKVRIKGVKDSLETHYIPLVSAFRLAADRKLHLPATPSPPPMVQADE